MAMETTTPADTTLKVYPKDTVIFDRGSVSLEIPDRLVASSFTTATKVSKLIADLIKNSARRFSLFALFFKPIFGDALIIRDTATFKFLNMSSTTTVMPADPVDEIVDYDVTTLQPEVTTLEENSVDTTLDTLNDIDNDIF